MDENEKMRRIFLAGVGMLSEACDVTRHTLEELAEKGSEFLDQQSEKTKKWFDEMVVKGEKLMSDVKEDFRAAREEEVFSSVERMSPEERERLREKMDRMS